ncbi:MAG TPA: type II CAAX endopeptidase family protein [Chitinophagaceae bacterium]
MQNRSILLFVVLTIVITWSVEIPVALANYGYLTIKIPKGLQTLSTLAPGIGALLITAFLPGKNGIAKLLKPLFQWRIGLKWYAFIFVTGILLPFLSLLIFSVVSRQPIMIESGTSLLFYLAILLFFSPLWEEIGWRGFLLPRLQLMYSAFHSSLIIGVIWGLWHLPIILAINPYGDKSIIYFLFIFLGCIAISILQTSILNVTKGSLLTCVLLHDSINASAAYFYSGLSKNEFGPFKIFTGFLILIALVIYIKTRGKLYFSNMHTEVPTHL